MQILFRAALMATALVAAGCTGAPADEPVAILVEVPRPAGVSDAQLAAAFREALPDYADLDGLERKYFTYSDDGVGGVYLWRSRAAAEAFHDRDWSARLRETYRAEPSLAWFDVPAATPGGASEAAGANAVVAIVRVTAPWYAPGALIRRRMDEAVARYRGIPDLDYKLFSIAADRRVGGIYLWRDLSAAENFHDVDWAADIRDSYGEAAELTLLKSPVQLTRSEGRQR